MSQPLFEILVFFVALTSTVKDHFWQILTVFLTVKDPNASLSYVELLWNNRVIVGTDFLIKSRMCMLNNSLQRAAA